MAINEHIGSVGNGIFNQSGGSNTVLDWLEIGCQGDMGSSIPPDVKGIYNLSGDGRLSSDREQIG